MDEKRMQLAQALLGGGAAQQGAQLQQLFPMYQQQQIEAQSSGQQLPPFEQWAQQFQQQAPQQGM